MAESWKKLALTAGAMAISAAASAAPPNAAMLSNACAGCHGTHGASAGPSMPSLAGQSKAMVVESMKDFKSGKRPSTIMGRLAKGYSDAEIEAMGTFFAGQKPHRADQALDAAKVAQGKALHDKHCKRCHIEEGREGKEGNESVLAGQWLQYLQIQNADYLSGKRPMEEKMAEKVKPLTADEMDALAHFFASVK